MLCLSDLCIPVNRLPSPSRADYAASTFSGHSSSGSLDRIHSTPNQLVASGPPPRVPPRSSSRPKPKPLPPPPRGSSLRSSTSSTTSQASVKSTGQSILLEPKPTVATVIQSPTTLSPPSSCTDSLPVRAPIIVSIASRLDLTADSHLTRMRATTSPQSHLQRDQGSLESSRPQLPTPPRSRRLSDSTAVHRYTSPRASGSTVENRLSTGWSVPSVTGMRNRRLSLVSNP